MVLVQAEKADAERCAAGLAEQLERAQRAAAEAALEADAARAAIVAKAAAEQAKLLHRMRMTQAGNATSHGRSLHPERRCLVRYETTTCPGIGDLSLPT